MAFLGSVSDGGVGLVTVWFLADWLVMTLLGWTVVRVILDRLSIGTPFDLLADILARFWVTGTSELEGTRMTW